jgi:hypothetical protein
MVAAPLAVAHPSEGEQCLDERTERARKRPQVPADSSTTIRHAIFEVREMEACLYLGNGIHQRFIDVQTFPTFCESL